jgi:UDP-glucuronate decarboxylase
VKTILITGGAGFIGSNLSRRLLSEGNKVVTIDNFFTGKLENILDLQKNNNYNIINYDICNPILPIISKVYKNTKIDEIYNLACPASPPHYQINPLKTIQVSTVGLPNVLELAKAHGAKLLQASTSEVYGDPLEHPQKETYKGNVNPVGPRACYDEGKRVAETICIAYHQQFDVPIKLARIFNTYGPYMSADDGRVVSNFIIQALENKDITIYGDGSQTRSFQYVDDLVEAFTRLMATDNSITGPINTGNPYEFTVKELAEKVIDMTGSKSKVIYMNLPIDDPTQRKPDITLAQNILGWSPKIQLEEGLGYTIDYFKKVIGK